METEKAESDKKLEEATKAFELDKSQLVANHEKDLAVLNENHIKVLRLMEKDVSDKKNAEFASVMEENKALKVRCETLEKLIVALKQYHKQHLVSDTLFADLQQLEEQIHGFDQVLGLSDSKEV